MHAASLGIDYGPRLLALVVGYAYEYVTLRRQSLIQSVNSGTIRYSLVSRIVGCSIGEKMASF